MSFTYAINLKGDFASAASQAAAAGKSLNSQLTSLSKTDYDAAMMKAAHATFSLRDSLTDALSGTKSFGDAFSSLLSPAMAVTASLAILKTSFELTAVAAAAATTVIVAGAIKALGASEAYEALNRRLGSDTLNAIRAIEKDLPQSEATIASWAASLKAAGVTDLSRLQSQIKAIAAAETQVEGGAEKVRSILAKLAEAQAQGTKFRFSVQMLAGTGVTQEELLKQLGLTAPQMQAAIKQGKLTGTQVADAITAALNAKGAKGIEGALGTMASIMTHFKDDVNKIFEAVNASPFIKGLKSIADMFSQSSKTGQAFKLIVTSTFSGLFALLGKVAPIARAFVLGLAIGMLKAYIAAKPLVSQIKEFVNNKDKMQALGRVALWLGETLAGSFGHAIQAVSGFIRIANALAAPISAIVKLLSPAKGASLGGGFVDGITSGVTSAIGSAVAAVRSLGTSMLGAFTSMFQIHSPSQLMREKARMLPRGVEAGVNDEAPRAGNAIAKLGHTPLASNVNSSKSSSAVYHISIAAAPNASPEAKAGLELTISMLADTLERLGAMAGT